MKIKNVIASLSFASLVIAPAVFAVGPGDEPASQQSPAAAGATNSASNFLGRAGLQPSRSPTVADAANSASNSEPAPPPAQRGYGRATAGTVSSGGSSAGSGGFGGGGGSGGAGWAANGGVSSDQIMQQVQQAMKVAVDSADAALANASHATSAALASADAALQDADRTTQEAVQSQFLPKLAEFQNKLKRIERGPSHDSAAVIVTHPLDPQSRADWQEDLKVMDKLLRDEIAGIDGGSVQLFMGIDVWRAGRWAEPMYLEDFGAVFSYRAGFPLLAAESAQPKRAESPDRQPESAWDRAKAELESPQGSDTDSMAVHRNAQRLQSQLINSILQVLPQAKNIRQLKESESVVVTVAGANDAGKPARLTLKAKKEDIEQAASGKLKPEEFKARVAWTIN